MSFQNRRRTGSPDGRTAKLNEASLYAALLRALTRREHSRTELVTKFSSRVECEEVLEAALDRLVEDGYQCDERFAEVFVRSRVGRGQGPSRIEQELRQRGVASELIDRVLEACDADWEALALAAVQKRFSGLEGDEPLAQDDWARAGRFLAGRGFPSDLIYRVLRMRG